MEVRRYTHVANEKNSSFGVQNWSWIGVGVTKSSDSPNLPSFQVNIYLCINACLKERKKWDALQRYIAQYWFFILLIPKVYPKQLKIAPYLSTIFVVQIQVFCEKIWQIDTERDIQNSWYHISLVCSDITIFECQHD